MKVENKIHIYSINDKDTATGEKTEFVVRNVWNKKQFIEIQIGDGPKVVVHHSELSKALSNSTGNEF